MIWLNKLKRIELWIRRLLRKNFGEKEAILTSVYCVNLIAAVKGTYDQKGVKKNRIEIDTDVAMMITHHMAGISHLVNSMLDDGAFDELAE